MGALTLSASLCVCASGTCRLPRATPQAHAFQHGLKLNPTDKTLRQGFW